jgi:hypothetical protein
MHEQQRQGVFETRLCCRLRRRDGQDALNRIGICYRGCRFATHVFAVRTWRVATFERLHHLEAFVSSRNVPPFEDTRIDALVVL